jgi:hypothetical protein
VWKSPLFKKLFSFTCNTEFIREETLKLLRGALPFLIYYLLCENIFSISAWIATQFPNIVYYSYTFCPQMNSDDLLSSKVVADKFVAPFKILH